MGKRGRSLAEGNGPGGGAHRGARSRHARYRKLKPRPGRSGAEVAEHQRARIHAATIELVDEGGYEALTVTGIARAAGVSTHTFYENFADKEDCFRATYELIVRHTAREVLAARHRQTDSRAKMRAGFHAFVREVSGKPEAARLALVEGFSCRAAFEQMQHTFGLFEALVAESYREECDGAALPPLVVKGIVAGITRVARARVLGEADRELAKEADELMDWSLSLCSDRAGEVCSGSVLFPRAASLPMPGRPGDWPKAGEELTAPGDERAMIAAAVARLAAEEGFAALTIPRIRAAAGISRRRFEEHFGDVTDCFIAAVEMLVGRVLGRAREAYLTGDSWPSGVHRAMERICRDIADDPALVRLVFFELYVPAAEAIRWHAELIANLCSALRESAPALQRPCPLAAEASIGAVWAILHHYATTGRSADVAKLGGTVTYLLLAPAIGAEEAVKVIHAERDRVHLAADR